MPSSIHNVWKRILKQWILHITSVSCPWKRQCYVLLYYKFIENYSMLKLSLWWRKRFSIFSGKQLELYCFNSWGFTCLLQKKLSHNSASWSFWQILSVKEEEIINYMNRRDPCVYIHISVYTHICKCVYMCVHTHTHKCVFSKYLCVCVYILRHTHIYI